MNNSVLIIGAGQAGIEIAATLRGEGFDGDVTIVGSEQIGPYQRPPLSKGYLNGDADEETLEFRASDYYEDKRITLIINERIVSVGFTDDGGHAVGESGSEYSFDRLALTPGSSPRRLLLEGSDLEGVLYLRDIGDARTLRSLWGEAATIVVIGGGFIGLEVAAAAAKAGKVATVIEAADRLMARAVAPVTSEFYRTAHERRGVSVRLSAVLSHIVGEAGRVTGVELSTGEVIPADIVLVGIGVLPRTELAAMLQLETLNGAIVVDEFALTSDPRVVAAGDATVLPHPLGLDSLVRLESVQNAVDQAKIAAYTLLGRNVPYRAVPWFWSDQADLKLQIAGVSTGYDHLVVRGDPGEEQFSVLYYADDRLLAIDAINRAADYMTVRRALANGHTIRADSAADVSLPLKSLVVQDE